MGPTKGRSAVDPRIGQWKDWIHNCLLMNLMIQATVSNIKPFTHISKLFLFFLFFFNSMVNRMDPKEWVCVWKERK